MKILKKLGGVIFFVLTSNSILADDINSNANLVPTFHIPNETNAKWEELEQELKRKGVFNQTVFLNTKNAFETDIQLTAKKHNLDIETTRDVMLFQKAFVNYLKELRENYPNQISSFYLEKFPEKKGHIKFVDEVPQELIDTVNKNHYEDNIILAGGGKISQKDHYKRAEHIASVLNKKYPNVSAATYFDNVDGVIKVEMYVPFDLQKPTTQQLYKDLRATMNKSSLKGRAALIEDHDISFNIKHHNGPIVEKHTARGGAKHTVFEIDLADDGITSRTSGWSAKIGSTNGILTCGHCIAPGNEPKKITDHTNATESSLEYISSSTTYGDVGFMTTETDEVAEFYANEDNDIRYVTEVKPENELVVGSIVCFFGRATDYRECGLEVGAIDISYNGMQGFVRVNDPVGYKGDSGGGWSFGSTAWGIHMGRDSNNKGLFTPAYLAQEKLGVTILTY